MRAALIVAMLAGFAPLARAEVESGPKIGAKIPALKVFAVTGDPSDKEVDYAGLRKDKPTIYVFVAADKFSRPMHRYLKTLDEKIGDDALVVAIWLNDDADKSKEYLGRISKYYTNAALTVFGEKAGPKDWGINTDAHLTTVVVNKGKVVKSFGYMSLNDTDVPPVLEALKKSIKK